MPFARAQAQATAGSGIEVQIFYLESRTSVASLAKERSRFRRSIKLFAPDIVHAHFGTMTGFFCAVGCTVPLIITYRGSDLNPAPSMNFLRWALGHLLSQLAATRAALIICVSASLKERLWWRRQRAEVLPSGPNMELFRPRPKGEARAALGLDPLSPIILFNSRDPAVKRLDLAQDVARKVRRRLPDLQLAILDGKVPQRDVATHMNAADCLLLTSDWEGSPDIVKEALACGLPVVSVDVGDVGDLLTGVSPSRIAERDAVRLAQAVLEVLQDGRRSNGRERVKGISDGAIASRLASLYQRVLAERSKSG